MESLAASVLNRVLGEYISDLQTKQLSIAVWDGNVKLQNLKLKPTIFNRFKAPFDLIYGNIGNLSIQIPWNDLKNKPLRLNIENVFVLVKLVDKEYDPEAEEIALQQQKQQKLKDKEEAFLQNTGEQSGYFSQLSGQLIDNIQIMIKNIHIRFDNSKTLPLNFGCGFFLKELSAISTDENWVACTVLNTNTIHKVYRVNIAPCFREFRILLRYG